MVDDKRPASSDTNTHKNNSTQTRIYYRIVGIYSLERAPNRKLTHENLIATLPRPDNENLTQQTYPAIYGNQLTL